MGLELRPLLLGAQLAVGLLGLRPGNDVAHFVIGVARVQNPHLVDHHALFHLAVGALDEAVIVDAGKAGERRDQADVRTFRRFDGADAAVVRGMHVAHFESGALAAKDRPDQAPKDAACA